MLGSWNGMVEVIVPTQAGRRIPGIAVHRCASLRPRDVVVLDGLRCTTPARTLVDLAAVAPRLLPRALTEAERLHLDVGGAVTLLALEPGRRGAGALARALAAHDPRTAETRSALEVRFLGLVRAAGLPAPQVNVVVDAGRLRPEVDFLWPAERVAVEVDGREFHDIVATAEADRARDNALALTGHLVLRFTWRRLEADRAGVVREVAAALRSRAPRPPRDRAPASPR
jgi:very-short-patch-repair endonuclease